jgi:serine phosphatase RsbU (regulator of sigma subunit)
MTESHAAATDLAETEPAETELEALRATLALERRRLERELEFARRIQINLMPLAALQPPGWEIATAYRAARMVGGDFYDVFELPAFPGSVGLVVADVTGKGITGALMMAFTRAVLRSAAYNGSGPADALERTNRVLVREARTGLFVTALAARLDTQASTLTWSSAGHEAPLLMHAGAGEIEELPGGGHLLGLAEGASTPDRSIELRPGDLVLFITDGITDALRDDGQRFGEDRLRSALRDSIGLPASETVGLILQSVDAFSGSTDQADDLTLLAVRRQP